MRKYPHMKPADVVIWEKFIAQNPSAYENVVYDLAVGTGPEAPEGSDEAIQRDITILGQRKIDVVGFTGNEVHIIEVKPRAGTSAFGQVKGYEALYKKFINENAETKAVVITDSETPDVDLLSEAMGVKVVVVKPE